MTIVAALITPKGCWMGADSLSSDDLTCATVSSPKVGRFGNKLVGFSGNWDGIRILDIARRSPEISAEELLFRSGPFKEGLVLLIIENGALYFVQEEKTLIRRQRKQGYAYDAIGSGASHALGSLYSSHKGREDVLTSLKAAAHHNPHCRAPFRIVSL